jgi:O-antigen ligase
MIANNRRLAWMELDAAIFTLYVISPRTRLKLLLTRTVVLAIPLVMVYAVAGWNSKSAVFAPVQLFRSVEDADSDVERSTLFRDLENYNLLATLRYNPFVGTGFGHPYSEEVKLDDISFFKEYRFLPHNSVLGLWGFCGVFGFTGLSVPLVVAVFLGARSYNRARSPDERVAASAVLAMVVIYLIQAWGDIGFSEKRSIFLVSAALAVAGRLAVSTGAWGAGPARLKEVPL